jgi:hypothetical protein
VVVHVPDEVVRVSIVAALTSASVKSVVAYPDDAPLTTTR